MKNIKEQDFNISGEIFISAGCSSKESLIELKELFEKTTGKFYKYGMYRDISGYYKGFDFINNNYIYCASLKQKEALKLIENYIKRLNL